MASLLVRGSLEPLCGRLSHGKRGVRSRVQNKDCTSNFGMLLPLSSSLQLICLSSVMFETEMTEWSRRIAFGEVDCTIQLVWSCPCTSGEVCCTAWVEVTHVGLTPDLRVKLSQRWSHWRYAALPQAWLLELETRQSLFNCKVLQCLLRFAPTWKGVMKNGKCKGLTYQQCLAQQPQCAWPSHWVAPVWPGNQLCVSLILLPSADCAWFLEVLHVAAAAEKPTCTTRIRGLFGISCSSQFHRRCRGVKLYFNLVRSRVR